MLQKVNILIQEQNQINKVFDKKTKKKTTKNNMFL
jgi:hypothetical protein